MCERLHEYKTSEMKITLRTFASRALSATAGQASGTPPHRAATAACAPLAFIDSPRGLPTTRHLRCPPTRVSRTPVLPLEPQYNANPGSNVT
ncbi:hypothetical protein K1T71_004562 [Dendrolimus kikuchii]|uniref:Uncharacterized protein n=1 Tax=Dendrolimus kikuchii TaxID=765133 RepID=A0ACC1D8G3_9NEOP|nr:hypothetical protein K1T71_004562 [Dendrolimus kikuchii]